MGGGSKQTTQQTTQTQLPQWVIDAGQSNYNIAKDIASNPGALYTGDTQVGASPLQTQAFGAAGAQSGTLQPQVQGVIASANQNNLAPFMNPYQQQVIDTSLAALRQSQDLSMRDLNANATASNAFGGSRAGVQAGVLGAQGAMAAGQLAAQLGSAGYNQAQAQKNINTQQNFSGISQISGLNQQDLNSLLTGGANQRQIMQSILDNNIARVNQPTTNREQLLGLLQSSLGQTPYNTTTTSNGTTTKSSSPDWATAGLGLLKLGGSFI